MKKTRREDEYGIDKYGGAVTKGTRLRLHGMDAAAITLTLRSTSRYSYEDSPTW